MRLGWKWGFDNCGFQMPHPWGILTDQIPHILCGAEKKPRIVLLSQNNFLIVFSVCCQILSFFSNSRQKFDTQMPHLCQHWGRWGRPLIGALCCTDYCRKGVCVCVCVCVCVVWCLHKGGWSFFLPCLGLSVLKSNPRGPDRFGYSVSFSQDIETCKCTFYTSLVVASCWLVCC